MSGLIEMMERARASTAIRVFVGSDPRQGPAERVLEWSIRQRTAATVDFFWLRAGDPGFEVGPRSEGEIWNIGREPGHPKSGKWGTDFSCFRMAIPEICGWKGRAIYLDSDMIVLGDIHELWCLPMAAAWKATSAKVMDVCLIDCSSSPPWFNAGIPSIVQMRRGVTLAEMRAHLNAMGALDPTLPAEWNCRDGDGYVAGKTKLLHFTDVTTQPWSPWPEAVEYREHPSPACRALWESSLEAATA